MNDGYSRGVAPYYDLFADANPARNEQARFLAPLIVPDCRVLDIGAGTGSTAFALAEQGARVTALEPDAEMYGALLTRLSEQPTIAPRVSPVPEAAGFRFAAPFDLCCAFAVLHLIPEEAQDSLVAYAKSQTRLVGTIVLDMPVRSPARAPRPWSVVASRDLGALRIEHHSAMEPRPGGSWQTHWRFVTLLGDRVVREVRRTFDWRPLNIDRSDALLRTPDLEIAGDFSGYDRAPFKPGESTTRLVVARVSSGTKRRVT